MIHAPIREAGEPQDQTGQMENSKKTICTFEPPPHTHTHKGRIAGSHAFLQLCVWLL